MNLSELARSGVSWVAVVSAAFFSFGYVVGVELESRRWAKMVAREHGRMMKGAQ